MPGILKRIQKKFPKVELKHFLLPDPKQIERSVFPKILREMVIEALMSGSELARDFRENYSVYRDPAHDPATFKAYLKQQAKPGAYLTQLELALLAELFECNLHITDIHPQHGERKYFGYEAENKENAETIELKFEQRPNDKRGLANHWFIKKYSDTDGDGNCGVKAFAKELQRLVLVEDAALESAKQAKAQTGEAKEIERAIKLSLSEQAPTQVVTEQVHSNQFNLLGFAEPVMSLALEYPEASRSLLVGFVVTSALMLASVDSSLTVGAVATTVAGAGQAAYKALYGKAVDLDDEVDKKRPGSPGSNL
ncbi:MAG: hypothetical protein K0U24_04900 [Gammaproteobacteria bacterium]|nr:hypothetical protein [Gammaproteobacteria bacterium]